jgi:farnesyl-diphosphate farnesyltransferase
LRGAMDEQVTKARQIADLLQKTSRTFALTIPFLPEPTRKEVSVAYLLFRIIDTFEDATHWAAARRVETLTWFMDLVDKPPAAAAALVQACEREPPVDHVGYRELLGKIPLVLQAFQDLRPGARTPIGWHLGRSAEGMKGFVARADGRHGLVLETVDDLRAYCYAVAGIVGEMLTELFLLGRPELAAVGEELRSRAAEFGEGLQLVNILKDAGKDALESRVYLPRRAASAEIFALAHSDLCAAAAYTETLRGAGAELGLVAFNAFVSKLALGTLRVLRERGTGAKLSRLEVMATSADVSRALGRGEPLFPELRPSPRGPRDTRPNASREPETPPHRS